MPISSSPKIKISGLTGGNSSIAEYCYVSNTNITASVSVFDGVDSTLYSDVYISALLNSEIIYYLHDCYTYNVNITTPHTASGISNQIYLNSSSFNNPIFYNIYVANHYIDCNPENVYVISTLIDRNDISIDWPQNLYYLSESNTSTFVDPNSIPTQNSSFATGNLDSEMKITSSFVGFDFYNIWTATSSFQGGYPYFKWQILPDQQQVSYDVLKILSPNGNEIYRFGKPITISWEVTQSYEVIIQGFIP